MKRYSMLVTATPGGGGRQTKPDAKLN